jgi:hypothetical protein
MDTAGTCFRLPMPRVKNKCHSSNKKTCTQTRSAISNSCHPTTNRKARKIQILLSEILGPKVHHSQRRMHSAADSSRRLGHCSPFHDCRFPLPLSTLPARQLFLGNAPLAWQSSTDQSLLLARSEVTNPPELGERWWWWVGVSRKKHDKSLTDGGQR